MSNVTTKTLQSELAKFTKTVDFNTFTKQVKDNYVTKKELDPYAKKSELTGYQPKGEYVTADDVKAANFATRGDLVNYATNSDLDKNFASKLDLDGYQKKGDYVLNEELQQNYALKSELTEYQPKGNYLLRTELPSGLNPNLYQAKGDYALKTDLDRFQPKGEYALRTQIPNVGDFQLKGDYALKSELTGYQPKGDYALKSEIAGFQPKGDYALRSQIPNFGDFQQKGDYALKSELDRFQPKGEYASKSELAGYQPKGEYALKSQIPDLNNYQPKGDYQPKGEYALKSDLNAYQIKGGDSTIDFDAFSGGGDAVFSVNDWHVDAQSRGWDPLIRGNDQRKGLSHTHAEWNTETSATADINVPAGMKSGFLFHLAWVNCRYFDIFGVTASGKYIFIRRVNAYQNVQNTVQEDLHDGVQMIPIPAVNRFAKIRIQGRKGRIHYMGMGWTKNMLVPNGETGYVSGDNIIGPSIRVSDRWTIVDENGSLIFRDNQSGGDKRYAMFANKFVDLNEGGGGGGTGPFPNLSIVSGGPLTIRDEYHGLKWRASEDGPFVHGYSGGALGTRQQSGEATALAWTRDGTINMTGPGHVNKYNDDRNGYALSAWGAKDGGWGIVFKNGADRGADGGPKTMTVRNDDGNLRLQATNGEVIVENNCLRIGQHKLCSEDASLVIHRPGHPKKIILWTGGDHSSMMTQRNNGTDHWFGY